MIQCIINEALIGVLGIQDICHFTFRDMGYFSFYFQVYGVLVILLQGIWDTVFIIFIYFQGYRQGWQSTGQYAYWPDQWSILVLTGHYWCGDQLVD